MNELLLISFKFTKLLNKTEQVQFLYMGFLFILHCSSRFYILINKQKKKKQETYDEK